MSYFTNVIVYIITLKHIKVSDFDEIEYYPMLKLCTHTN